MIRFLIAPPFTRKTPRKLNYFNFQQPIISNDHSKNKSKSQLNTFNKDVKNLEKVSRHRQGPFRPKSRICSLVPVSRIEDSQTFAQINVKWYRIKLHHQNFNIFLSNLSYADLIKIIVQVCANRVDVNARKAQCCVLSHKRIFDPFVQVVGRWQNRKLLTFWVHLMIMF